MQSSSVPKKEVALSAVSIKDIKTRRLFILADGKKSLEQIYQLCNVDKNLGSELMEVLLDEGYISLTGNQTTAAPTPPAPAKQSDTDQQDQQLVSTTDFTASLTEELAKYIGPVAPMMVKRIALPENGLTKEAIDWTINTLAEEIEDDKDKEQFIENMGVAS